MNLKESVGWKVNEKFTGKEQRWKLCNDIA